MKVTVDVDCTPEEARRFLGLPDLGPIHAAYIEKMQKALADNAASLAGAEHDPLALDLAITTYEGLLKESISPTQTRALQQTLETLRSWKV